MPAPVPEPSQVLIENRHIALNYYDVWSSASRPNGFIPGWDSSGIVVRAAAVGAGPAMGARVAATNPAQGGWAELRAVEVTDLAVVPDGVDLALAAALPVAGVSALRALRDSGSLFGRRVLVTGAAGGVGHFAIQLAANSGAEVIASVGSAGRGGHLSALGASLVVVGLSGISRDIDVVIDTVGGDQMAAAFALLREGGVLQSVGVSSNQPTVFAPYATLGGSRALRTFSTGPQVGHDLEYLLTLVLQGKLKVQIGWRGSWDLLAAAAKLLLDRAVVGKVVLDI
ncbi:MAG TPA: zinc-binding dehydrogenase [Isosphaeraceae bacterium]|nr:zinc-binding dehydrogenase [Isosphaeraceae bacterium]